MVNIGHTSSYAIKVFTRKLYDIICIKVRSLHKYVLLIAYIAM